MGKESILVEFPSDKMPGPIRIYVWGSLAACKVLEPMERERVAVSKPRHGKVKYLPRPHLLEEAESIQT